MHRICTQLAKFLLEKRILYYITFFWIYNYARNVWDGRFFIYILISEMT